MKIGEAIEKMRDGNFIARKNWNGPNQYLGLQIPDKGSVNTLPYIYMITVTKDRVPWPVSQTDLLADDWFIHSL